MAKHVLHFELVSEPTVLDLTGWDKKETVPRIVNEISVKLSIEHLKTGHMEEIDFFISLPHLIFPYKYKHTSPNSYLSSKGCLIFNCQCGHSECVSISSGVKLKLVDNNLIWHIPKDDGYKFLLSKKYVFDAVDYNQKIQNILNKLLQLEKDNPRQNIINGSFIKGFVKGTLVTFSHMVSRSYFKPIFFPELEKYLQQSFKGLSQASIVYKINTEFMTPFLKKTFPD